MLKKYYVLFVISDGDNVVYNLWSMKEYCDSLDCGFFDVGYGISLLLVDLVLLVMVLYYWDVLCGVINEDFIVGLSGIGYMYLSWMFFVDLDCYVIRMNQYLGVVDLSIVEIFEDQNVFNCGLLWMKFFQQLNVDVFFYFGFDVNGGINWYVGKLVIV